MSQRHILIYILYLPTRLVRSARSAYRHRGLSLLAPRFVEQLNIIIARYAMLMFTINTGMIQESPVSPKVMYLLREFPMVGCDDLLLVRFELVRVGS